MRCQPLRRALAFKERNLYIPGKFKQEKIEELVGLIREYPFATIITLSESGIDTNHLPLCLMELDGELYLKGHIAKANSLWKTTEPQSEAVVIFNGPNTYISPNNYPTKKENGKAVPTWNYVVVHVKGKIRFIHDPQWIVGVLKRLTSENEREQVVPWSMSDAPESYIQNMLSAVVGIEIAIDSLSGKWKLSQNQSEINQKGVVDGLSSKSDTNSQAIASMMCTNLQQEC
ncbi:FMN-binding negative transcriptional regulator [Vibrio mimicus]|nr:FMN-binding negative transcriptional regulator [Vibrio mimicus]MBY7676635.1 FMN-binding negative transcriptional regulator [Vibrio mimicus]MBY7728465.1 FMN-binding negative transcriptional regulator [Vibrio mimicus]